MLLYAITNRRLLEGDENAKRDAWWSWPAAGPAAAWIPFRSARGTWRSPSCSALAARVVEAVRAAKGKTRVLVNGPAQVALDAGADGVHLHANAGPACACAPRSRSTRVPGASR